MGGCVSVFVVCVLCVWVCLCTWAPLEERRGYCSLWNWSYRRLWVTQCECWRLNSYPVGEPQALNDWAILMTPSYQTKVWNCEGKHEFVPLGCWCLDGMIEYGSGDYFKTFYVQQSMHTRNHLRNKSVQPIDTDLETRPSTASVLPISRSQIQHSKPNEPTRPCILIAGPWCFDGWTLVIYLKNESGIRM